MPVVWGYYKLRSPDIQIYVARDQLAIVLSTPLCQKYEAKYRQKTLLLLQCLFNNSSRKPRSRDDKQPIMAAILNVARLHEVGNGTQCRLLTIFDTEE